MNLSDGEKLILVMLSDIYEKLKVDGDIDPVFVKKAVSHDHPWALKWKYNGVFGSSSETNPPVVDQVVDILNMWRILEHDYKHLSQADKDKIKSVTPSWAIQFYGFDGNHESEYLSVAQFLIHQLRRFPEFEDRELNSHRGTLDHYSKILAELQLIRESEGYGPLNVDQLIRIFRAGYL